MARSAWFTGAAVFFIAGCGGSADDAAGAEAPGAASDEATGTQLAAAPGAAVEAAGSTIDKAADEQAVRDAVARTYASYSDPQAAAPKLSPAFQTVWDRAIGPDGAMDFDPFCECQDFDAFGVQIQSVEIAGQTARVRVILTNFGEPLAKRLTYAKVAVEWLLDDMSVGDDPSFRKTMATEPAGSFSI